MQSSLNLVDVLLLVAYLAFTTWLGVRFSAKQTSSGAFFLGSKALPSWAIAMSMFATIISSWAFMALPGRGFMGGIGYLLAITMAPVTLRMRRSRIDLPPRPDDAITSISSKRKSSSAEVTDSTNAATCGLSSRFAIVRPAVV